MILTKNFTLKEFTVNRWANEEQQKRSDESLTADVLCNIQELSNNLQVLRDYLNAPISINIAFRPKWWELLKGRSGKSQHTLGKAGDIVVEGYTPKQVAKAIIKLISEGKMSQGGLKAYNSFTHYDIRGHKARW